VILYLLKINWEVLEEELVREELDRTPLMWEVVLFFSFLFSIL
jgi:hypothetical protein